MKKLTFPQLIKAHLALNSLVEQDKTKAYAFPSAARIRMGANLRKIRELSDTIQKEQTELFKTYGTPVADKPDQYQVLRTSEKWAEFEKAYDDLNKEEFDIEIQTMSEVELINTRTVKSRDEKGYVSENVVENQVPMDLIADLQAASILAV